MLKKISHATLYVEDQDKALDFYTKKLGFQKTMDMKNEDGFRWLTVAPPEDTTSAIVLMKATSPEEKKLVGKQVLDKPLFVIETDDARKSHSELKAQRVKMLSEPKENSWGTDFMFADLYGNMFNVVEMKMG